MGITYKQMKGLLAQAGETQDFVKWWKQQNEMLQKSIDDISISPPQLDGVGGRSGISDTVAREVINRERLKESLALNERAIRDRLNLHSRLSLLMAEVLTKDERAVIKAKHWDQKHWWKVEKETKLSRTSCYRHEQKGMKKLQKAWDEAEERSRD